MLLYSIVPALGFSTVENIAYFLSQTSDFSWSNIPIWYAILVALGRICISTPFHCMTAYLIGIGMIRRDILHERLSWKNIMMYPILFHGMHTRTYQLYSLT